MDIFKLFAPEPERLTPRIIEVIKPMFPKCEEDSATLLSYKLIAANTYKSLGLVSELIELGILSHNEIADARSALNNVDRSNLVRILMGERTPKVCPIHVALINRNISIPITNP